MVDPVPFDATDERSLGFALSELVRLIRRDFIERAKGHDLTPELWRLLYCLDRIQGCSQSQLAANLDVTTVTLGRMIDTLETRGLVRRAADPVDRRTTRLFLTKGAAAPIARMDELVDATRERAMQGLSDKDQDQLWRLLRKVRENLRANRRASPARKPNRGA